MKNYTELSFRISPYSEHIADAFIAELGEIGFDGFVCTADGFNAYILTSCFDKSSINALPLFQILPEQYQVSWKTTEIADQNWNKKWEDDFTPIIVKDKILVRAGFHSPRPDIPYEIIIEPEMSFGTGHHETTALMLEMILCFSTDMKDKQILDMGCGTGILSIMAAKTGAANILGIDIDEWSYRNALENIRKNRIRNTSVKIGNADLLAQEKEFDFILANINRNILLQDMPHYAKHLHPKGYLIMSGFYSEDLLLIRKKAEQLGLKLYNQKTENNWVAASFHK